MNVTVTVHIENVHIHINPDEKSAWPLALTVGESVPAKPSTHVVDLAAEMGVSVEKAAEACAEAPECDVASEAPAAEDAAAAAGTVIQLPATRRRRKSSTPDAVMSSDIIEQARQMCTASAAVYDEPVPELDANEPPFKPTTGEIVQPVAPDAPELAVIRDGLRILGFSDTAKAMAFVGELVGRPITRIGELDGDEVRDVVTHLANSGVTR